MTSRFRATRLQHAVSLVRFALPDALIEQSRRMVQEIDALSRQYEEMI